MAATKLVILPSGGQTSVFESEVAYLRNRITEYSDDFKFTNPSDLGALDQLLIQELLVFRYSHWLGRDADYDHEPINGPDISRRLKESSTEARQVRKALGIDKVSRDAQRDQDDVASYIDNLLRRAKQFGIHRNEQAAKAIELFQELSSKITLHDNMTAAERTQLEGATQDEIFDWIRTEAIPAFEEIDRKFRQDGPDAQRTWERL